MSTDSTSERTDDRIGLRFRNTEVSSVGTQVYLFTDIPNDDGGCLIHGTVRGPFSKKSQTLPATYQVADRGAGPTVLGRVHVTDPCCWSTQLPMVYRADLKIQRGDQVIHEIQAEFGISENMYATGRSLWIGKRTVLRGVGSQRAQWSDIAEWTEQSAAILADEPADTLCQQATDQGVSLVARLCGADDLVNRVRRLASCPCVLAVWIDEVNVDASLIDSIDETILFAANIDDADSCQHVQLAVWQVGDEIPDVVRSIEKPVIAVRPLSSSASLAEARAACDQLQRDLAPTLDLAGYFV